MPNTSVQLRDTVLRKIEDNLPDLCMDLARFQATGLLDSKPIRELISEISPLLKEHAMSFVTSQIGHAAVRMVARGNAPRATSPSAPASRPASRRHQFKPGELARLPEKGARARRVLSVGNVHGEPAIWFDNDAHSALCAYRFEFVPKGACCANENRSMSGGCLNCGDPAL
jgi:hypothetical protein